MGGASPRSGRSGGRAARRMARIRGANQPMTSDLSPGVVGPGLAGGRYAPLGTAEAEAIVDAAFRVLERTGLADAPRGASIVSPAPR